MIKSRAAQLKKEKESQLPEKPSIWRRNCRQERYAAFPPLYEDDQQTGTLTQKLMDEYGFIPQQILREAIADLYQKITKGQQEESAAQDVGDVRGNSYSDNYSEPVAPVDKTQDVSDVEENSYSGNHNEPVAPINKTQTVEDRWQELNQQIKTDIEGTDEISQETGLLIFEACQQWETAVPTSKRWSAIANICRRDEKLLKYLSDYAYGNHSEWRHNWGAMLASFENFEQELKWVGIIFRTDALIAMGYKIPATVEVKLGENKGKEGRIVELHGDTTAPILVEFNDSQEYFHWNELDILAEAETFSHYTTVEELAEGEYLEEPEESDAEIEQIPLEKAVDALISGNWEEIRDVFNQHPEVKSEAWDNLSATQKQRIISITPEIVKVLNQAKKDGVIAEYKEFATGMYRLKRPSTILWEPRVFNEFEVRHFLKVWRESVAK
ncbi:MAG: hypothetical protein AAF378_14960 [Cyanobacteria bacterium P01_A01_bin.84]